MIRASRPGLVAVLLLASLAPLGAAAQEFSITTDVFDRPALRILQDYTLRPDDTARQVVVLGGNARIEGRVSEDVVVVLGKAELTSTAVIEGSFVVVGGTVAIADGAKINRDFVVVGGADTPPAFSPGGQAVVVGTAGFGDRLRGLVPWLTRGLLLGRPIVPDLGWVWGIAGVFFLLNLILNLIFDAPVRSCAVTLRNTPFSAFMAGLLVMLLAGPVCVLLAVSVIGIAVIPFLLCALIAAGILGRVGFARWLGMSVVHQDDPQDRGQSIRSFTIGSAVMAIAYMIPFIGFLVWILAGVFGLGSATLAFYGSYRRENPRPPRKVAAPPAVIPPAAPLPVNEGAGGSSFRTETVEASQPAVPAEANPALSAVASPQPESETYRPEINGTLGFPKAAFLERLAALVLDAIAIGILAQIFNLDHDFDFPIGRVMVLLALIYHVGFWTWRGTTLGGMICQLRVVRVDSKRLEFPESLVRGLTGVFSLAVAGLGFLWILRDPERQGWHDRVAGTYVIKVPRTYPI